MIYKRYARILYYQVYKTAFLRKKTEAKMYMYIERNEQGLFLIFEKNEIIVEAIELPLITNKK